MQFGMQTMESKSGNVLIKVLIFALILAGLAAALYFVRQKQSLNSQADSNVAYLTLTPSKATLPAGVLVLIDPKRKPMVFAKVVINFDKSQVQLSADPVVTDKFKNVATVTSMADANSSGQIVISAGVDPQSSSPKLVATQLATLEFAAAATEVNPTTNNVSIDSSLSQVAVVPSNELDLNVTGSKLSTSAVTGDTRPKIQKDLGLALSVNKDEKGNNYISASWKAVCDTEDAAQCAADRPNFLNYTVAVRMAGTTSTLVSDPNDRNVGNVTSTKDFGDLNNLKPGDYFVNLRAIFKQKIWVQSPLKFFTVRGNGKIILK